MPQRTKELIEAAASASGKSFSAFVTDCAGREAEDVLLDRTIFHLSPDDLVSFLQTLDAPPPPTERLRALMNTKAPWEA